MHIVVLPLVMVAIIATVLGVFSASVDRSVDVTETSLDTIDKVAAKKNEVLQASINAGRDKVEIDNHSTEPVEILFVEYGFEKDGDTKRVSLHDNVQGTCEAGDKAKPLTIDPRNPQAFNPEHYMCKNEKGKAADLKTLSMTTVNGNKFEIRLTADVGEIVEALDVAEAVSDPICDSNDDAYNQNECFNKYPNDLTRIQSKIVDESNTIKDINSEIEKLKMRLGDGNITGAGDGTGFGSASAFGGFGKIHGSAQEDRFIFYGKDGIGIKDTVKPYTFPPDDTTFAALVDVNSEEHNKDIKFFNQYNSLHESPNVINYISQSLASGDVDKRNPLDLHRSGQVRVVGDGTALLKFNRDVDLNYKSEGATIATLTYTPVGLPNEIVEFLDYNGKVSNKFMIGNNFNICEENLASPSTIWSANRYATSCTPEYDCEVKLYQITGGASAEGNNNA
ncbi:MAG: hypothetical protein MPL62_11785, partial [Alphaproteobacteria bacterium]|nr:hypothetical protein [Alphaproteobacteria bacterium]